MSEKDYEDIIEGGDGSNGCIELAEALAEVRRMESEEEPGDSSQD